MKKILAALVLLLGLSVPSAFAQIATSCVPGSDKAWCITGTNIVAVPGMETVEIPDITTTVRDALTAVNGMVIYNTTTAQLEAYEAGSWSVLGGGGGTGDITDVFDCATGDCNSIALSDTDLLDMSSVSVSSTTEGLILPGHATDCSTAGTAEGQVCWEADDNVLYIGDGSTVISTGTGDVTDVFGCSSGDCASITIGATDLLDMSGSDASSGTEGLILPQHATACAGGTSEGQVCWEADADLLYIGDSSGLKAMGDAVVTTAESITGVWEIQDDTLFNFGNDADFGIRYDETTDNRLEIISNTAATTVINIENEEASNVTDLNLDGQLTVDTALGYGITTGIYFGDGDSGIYEVSDDILHFNLAGADRWIMDGGFFRGVDSAGPKLVNFVSTETFPTFLPNQGSTNTGVGGLSGDVTLISDGFAGLTVSRTDPQMNTNIFGGTIVDGGTGDYTLKLSTTLNATEAAGGSDLYTGLLMDITTTDVTGYDTVLLMDLQDDSTSVFSVDQAGDVVAAGDLTVTGGDIVLGTTSIFSGGDTASLNAIDAIDATTETTLEAAIDALPNLVFDALADDSISEADLKAVDTAVDEECLTFEASTGDFEWQACGGGGGFDGSGTGDVMTKFVDADTLTDSNMTSIETTPTTSANTKVLISGGTYGDSDSGTADYILKVDATLNDTQSAGGSDLFTGFLMDVTTTSTTGYNKVLLMDLQDDSTSKFSVNQAGEVSVGGATPVGGVSLLLPSGGGPAFPPLAFGDGREGIYSSGSQLYFVINNIVAAQIVSGSFFGNTTGAGMILFENSSYTNPVLNPDKDDFDTGIGQGVNDSLSLIGGGVEFIRGTETGSEVTVLINGRVSHAQGTDVASATNLTLSDDGTSFELTGTTKVDLIVNTNWRAGSRVTLIANESVVVDHGTTTSGANITLLLNGAADYSMTAGDTLTLLLSSTTAGGTAWREVSRSVN